MKKNKDYRNVEMALEDLLAYLKIQKEMLENTDSFGVPGYRIAKISRMENEIKKYQKAAKAVVKK